MYLISLKCLTSNVKYNFGQKNAYLIFCQKKLIFLTVVIDLIDNVKWRPLKKFYLSKVVYFEVESDASRLIFSAQDVHVGSRTVDVR